MGFDRKLLVLTWITATGCEALTSKTDDGEASTKDTGDVILDDIDDETDGIGVVDHCGVLEVDETWSANVTHAVKCDVTVERGVLTIEAGAVVIFEPGGGLEVGTEFDEASLRVMGTEAKPVQLRTEENADADSFWKGIFIGKNGKDVEIHHARISKGGNTLRAGLTFNGPVGLLDHVTIEDSGTCGLELASGGSLHPDSTHLTVRNSEIPVCSTLEVVHTLPATGSDYTGNSADYIEVRRDEIHESVEWEDLGVPYAFTDQVKVGGTAAVPAIIEIGPGTELQFANGKGLKLAFGGGASGLHARGTAEAPVTFTAMGSRVPGSWGGIDTALGVLPGEFTLSHTRIEYAGGGVSDAALYAYASEVKLDHVTIADCLQSGLGLRKGGRLHPDSDAILVSGCEEAAMMEPDAVGSLTDLDIRFEGNDLDRIRLAVGSSEQPLVTETVTWRDMGLPYYSEKGIMVEGDAESPAVLTLEAGVTVRFESNRGLIVGRGGAGTLHVEGTESAPVQLLPFTAAIPGSWSGLEFGSNSIGTSTLSNFVIDYAGGAGNDGAVDVLTGSVDIRDGMIRYSDGCGVYGREGHAQVTVADLTFVDIADSDLCGDVTSE